jgi:hypothetical protein
MKKQAINKTDTKKSSPKPTPKQRTEKDADDLVHSQEPGTGAAETSEEDLDDMVHRPKPHAGIIDTEDSLEDPDDLIHGYLEEEDD